VLPEVDSRGVTYRRACAEDEPGIRAALTHANMHLVPSPEMPELRLENYFVAEIGGEIIGCAGYTILPNGTGKTTLMTVVPAYRGWGIGRRLQELRMDAMRRLGCRVVITNADLPETIAWYQRNFGYREVGSLMKEHTFGSPAIDRWTTLEADLEAWYRKRCGPTL
jgi:ribosomal-protein-alanine N-acetyltransferase